jgi:hypothetical protein
MERVESLVAEGFVTHEELRQWSGYPECPVFRIAIAISDNGVLGPYTWHVDREGIIRAREHQKTRQLTRDR